HWHLEARASVSGHHRPERHRGHEHLAGAQNFILQLSDTDFSFPQGATHLVMSLGGTLTGSGNTISFDGYEDNTNTIFGTSGLHVGPATFGPGAFSGLLLAGSFPVAPY